MTEPTLRILSLGAGVQSTTLALMACDGTRIENFARLQALSDRVRQGPAYSTHHSEERYWLDLLALIERAEANHD